MQGSRSSEEGRGGEGKWILEIDIYRGERREGMGCDDVL